MLELVELRAHRHQPRRELAGLDAVLAPQSLELVQSILGELELTRLDLELLRELRGRARSLFAGHLRERELLFDLLERARVLAAVSRTLEQRRQSPRDRVVGLVQRRVRFTSELGPPLRIAQEQHALAQRIVIDRVGRRRLELLDLEAQVVDPSLALRSALAQLFQRTHRLAPLRMAPAMLRDRTAELRPRI